MSAVTDTSIWNDLSLKLMRQNVPLHALYEITEKCNYACTHCYLPHRRDGELTTEQAKAMLDSLADAGSMFLTLSGGEVFLRRDFFEIAEHARSRDFVLRIFTNGWFVDDENADRLAALNPIAVEISLYAPDAAAFELVTQVPGSFERTCGAIRRLVQRGVRTIAKTPIMTVNARRIGETADLAASLGADFKWDALIAPMDGGETVPYAMRATDEDMAAAFAWEKATHGEPPAPAGKDLDAAPCNAGRGSVAISPRGDVFPCIAIKTPAGNVRDKSFREIWERGEILTTVRSLTVGSLKECASCEDRPWCPRCAGMALHEVGSLTAPSHEACRVAANRRATFEGRPLAEPAHRSRLPIIS